VVEARTRPELANLVFANSGRVVGNAEAILLNFPIARDTPGIPGASCEYPIFYLPKPALLCQIARLKVLTNIDLVAGDRWVAMSQACSCRHA